MTETCNLCQKETSDPCWISVCTDQPLNEWYNRYYCTDCMNVSAGAEIPQLFLDQQTLVNKQTLDREHFWIWCIGCQVRVTKPTNPVAAELCYKDHSIIKWCSRCWSLETFNDFY